MEIMLERIKLLIGSKHGAKKELAEYLSIPQATITDWLYGRSKSYTKYSTQIAEFYNVSLDYLAGFTDVMDNEKPATNIDDGLSDFDLDLIRRLKALNPDQVEIVRAFVQGLQAGSKG